MNNILKVENLSKVYYPHGIKPVFNKVYKMSHAVKAVDDVSLEIREGEIYGLLGPNGAGKSTIIKLITGLSPKDGGKIYVCGHDIDTEKCEALANIGAIIETPSMFKNMSARDNLRYFATLNGDVDEAKIESALDMVGLKKRAEDKVGTYSLGMKQRLGIAEAMMSRPKLLVLDEPTNGLDPEWIMNIRGLLKKIAKEYGVAIMVCSHILSEMQELCDRVGILSEGKLVADMSVDEIASVGAGASTIVSYKVSDVVAAYELLNRQYSKVLVRNGLIYVELTEEEIPVITRLLMDNDINVYGIDTKKVTLEDVFKRLVVDRDQVGGDADAE